ncbi:hypothetical protein pb186bvf_011008 [Paramecium bursaria]
MGDVLQFDLIGQNSTALFANFLRQVKDLCDQYLIQIDEPQAQTVQVQKQKKTKKVKDPLAPKMPKSAFIYYFQEKREKFHKEYPDLQFQQITKLIANEWKELSKEKQQQYHDQFDIDRKRYQAEMEVYHQLNGNTKKIAKKTKGGAKKEKIIIEQEQEDSFGANIDDE